jgi:hypothetical protein
LTKSRVKIARETPKEFVNMTQPTLVRLPSFLALLAAKTIHDVKRRYRLNPKVLLSPQKYSTLIPQQTKEE